MNTCSWVCVGDPIGWQPDPDRPHACPAGQTCDPPNTVCDDDNVGQLAETLCHA